MSDDLRFFGLPWRLPGILGRLRLLPKEDPARPFETITFRLDNAAEIELHRDRITVHLTYDQSRQDEHHHYRRRLLRHPVIVAYYGVCPPFEFAYSARQPVCLVQRSA